MESMTRLFVTSKDKIQENITNGVINISDLVITNDTHELLFIEEDGSLINLTEEDSSPAVRAAVEELQRQAVTLFNKQAAMEETQEEMQERLAIVEENVQADWAETDTESDAYIKNKPFVPSETSHMGIGFGTCLTASGTAYKTVSIPEFKLKLNGIVAIRFTNGFNTTDTININGTGANYIYYQGVAVANGLIRPGTIALMIYDGTRWQLLTTDTPLIESIRTVTSTSAPAKIVIDMSDGTVFEAVPSSIIGQRYGVASLNSSGKVPEEQLDITDDLIPNNIIRETTLNEALETKLDKTDLPTRVSEFTNDAGYQNATQVSGAITTAIVNKADRTDIPTKVSQLENDSNYQTDSQVSESILSATMNKVDKETGKGLSENDYTTAEKNKLAGIEANATNTTIDSTLTIADDAADAKSVGDELSKTTRTYDSNTAIIPEGVNFDGTFSPSSTNSRTDYVDLSGALGYSLSESMSITVSYYDANKVYLESKYFSVDADELINTPTGVGYVIVSGTNAKMEGLRVNVTKNTFKKYVDDEIVDLKEDVNKKISAPSTPGTQGQVLTSDGEGGQTWEDPSGGTVTDVKVGGVSVLDAETGEANVPIASASKFGVVTVVANNGLEMVNGLFLAINGSTDAQSKAGTNEYRPITPAKQHISTFYGLAKAAGHDEKDSELPAGEYSDEAKSAIQEMLDVPSADEITQLQNNLIINSASGAIASFSDGGDDFPVRDLKVQMEPIQDLHGYDSPWPAGGGKNKVDIPSATVLSQSVLYSVDLSGGQYTLSATCANSTTISGYLSLRLSGVAKGTITIASGDSGVRKSTTFTLTEDGRYDVVGSGAASGYNFTVSDVQLELGSTATAYAPYSNICPITGRNSVKVMTRAGKNLFNGTVQQGTYANRNGVWVLEYSQSTFSTEPILVKPNTRYSMFAGTPLSELVATVYEFDANMEERTAYNSTQSYVTTTADTKYLAISGGIRSDFATSLKTLMLLEGDETPTAYEPYQGQTYDITFPTEAGTVYGGKLDVLSGVLTVDRAMVDMGDLNWEKYQNEGLFYSTTLRSVIKKGRSAGGYDNAISSAYAPANAGSLAALPDTSLSVDSSGNIQIRDSRHAASTGAEFKAALSGVQLVYELAEPQTYTLTPTEIRTLLGQNAVWSDADSVSVDYVADTKLYIEQLPEGVTDVQVNGTSILDSETGIANVPIASSSTLGVVKVGTSWGIRLTNNELVTNPATEGDIKSGANAYKPLASRYQHVSTFYGLAKAAGDTTQSQSSNAVGTYTDEAKAAIKNMLEISGECQTVTVSETTPTIQALSNTRYVCGEVSTLDFTPSAKGVCDVIFTSGVTPTVLTLPSTVVLPSWFDATALDADTTYEISISDGVYGAVMSW